MSGSMRWRSHRAALDLRGVFAGRSALPAAGVGDFRGHLRRLISLAVARPASPGSPAIAPTARPRCSALAGL